MSASERYLIASFALACVSCGPGVRGPQEPLPPNTVLACERAIDCEAVEPERLEHCVKCIETVADRWNARAHELYGEDVPPLESIPCPSVRVIARETNLEACAYEGWYGPGPRRPPRAAN